MATLPDGSEDVFAPEASTAGPAPAPQAADLLSAPQGAPQAAPGATPAPGLPGAPPAAPGGPTAGPTATPPAPGGGDAGDSSLSSMFDPDAAVANAITPGAGDAAQAALPLGAAKGAFAIKDFFATGAGLWGETPTEDQRSGFRQAVDAKSQALSTQFGPGYSISEGMAQGAVGLLGVAATGAEGVLLKAGASAVAVAASFEPHAQNFANMASVIPGIGPTLQQYLGSSDSDSTKVGYLKNGLVSLGFDTAMVGLFTASAAVVKAFTTGSKDTIEAAQADLAKAVQDHQVAQSEPAATGGEPSPTAATPPSSSTSGQPPSSPLDASGSPVPPSTSGDAGAIPPGSEPSGNAPGQPTEPGTPAPAEGAAANDNAGAVPTPVAASDATQQPGQVPAANDNAALAPGNLQPRFTISDDTVAGLIKSSEDDRAALDKWGSWDAAIANGHTFGATEKTPWQFIGSGTGEADTPMDALIARVKEAYKDQFDEMKGGEVQTDTMNASAVKNWSKLWGADPTRFLGALRMAGDQASDLRATMEAGYTVGLRILMDSHGLASRISAGEFGTFGNKEVALQALKQQVQMAAQVLGAANSISSNVGRAMRGLQGTFKLDPLTVRAIAGADGDRLVQIIKSTGGDPLKLKTAIQPGILSQISDALQFYRVNNLVSSIKTHAIIMTSNAFQVGARPGMRMFGAAAMDAPGAIKSVLSGERPSFPNYSTVGMEAQKQYAYYAASIPDALRSAWEAFKAGDGVLAPHDLAAAQEMGNGGSMASSGIAQQIAQLQWSKMDTPANILRNALVGGIKTLAFPTRAVGFQDEFVKQLVYRAQVQAKAAVEGVNELGLGAGTQALQDHVNSRLAEGFDQFGRATDQEALLEAKKATFQNDLEPTGWMGATQGAKAQAFLQNNPAARIVVPFLKTPVNLFRQGVQLTPGLNLFQTEYQEMLNGTRGATQQAQAIGQMAMGSLIMGTMGLLAHQGYVTGDGPSDPKLLSDAMKTGWRPNSFVHQNEDGSRTYVPYDRYDPVMMPMAMAANAVSVMMQPDMANQNKAESMLSAMSLGLLKQLVDKSYMQSVKETLDAVMYPDKSFAKWAGKMAGGYLPMSSALHLFNTDPLMREADGFVGNMLSQVPGFSKDFAPQRDWAGDEVSVHKGLWLDTPASQADAEVQRLALTQGGGVGAPNYKAKGGADLRDITMAGDQDPEAKGRTAYDRFQELAGHPERYPGAKGDEPALRDTIAKLIGTEDYQRLPDGDAATKGTKLSVLTDVIRRYREGALRYVSADSNVREAENAEQHRVISQLGALSGSPPTPTNQANSMLQRLGSMMGLHSLRVPSPATPTTALPQQGGQ